MVSDNHMNASASKDLHCARYLTSLPKRNLKEFSNVTSNLLMTFMTEKVMPTN